MSEKFHIAVIVGRFAPFHQGDLACVQCALQQAGRVLILCGSVNQPRSIINPWTLAERETMIRSCFSAQENDRIGIAPLPDVLYDDDRWVTLIQHHAKVYAKQVMGDNSIAAQFTVFSTDLERPSWSSLSGTWQCAPAYQDNPCYGYDIRARYFEGKSLADVPESVQAFLSRFRQDAAYKALLAEFHYSQDYKASWANTPYPPILLTADALVTHADQIIVIRRKALPGKGWLALPGGFVEPDEMLLQASMRELQEETCLTLPSSELKSYWQGTHVFDAPFRSSRGRVVTHVFHFAIPPQRPLPAIDGSDDAQEAMWLPIASLDPLQFFEDHYFIIQKILNLP